MSIFDERDLIANDPNVKVGQVYKHVIGYFKVTSVFGGFASILFDSGEQKEILRNMFQSNINEGTIMLVTDEIELAKALLLF
jgi:hypothetical protein